MKKERSFSDKDKNNKIDKKAVRRIFSVIFVMALTAAFFACLLISVTNDMYAFIKTDGEVVLTVSTPLSVSEFSRLLHDNDIISNPHIFSLYIKSKNKTEVVESFSGEALLDRSMSYREILLAIKK